IDLSLENGVLFIPSTMENKWAIYFHQNKLIFVRSWLREVLVVAETIQENNQLRVKKISGTFTDNESEQFTESVLNFLMHSHALNSIVPAPIPKEYKNNPDQAGWWAFSVYGNLAHYGYFEDLITYSTESKLRSHSLLHIAIAKGELEKVKAELKKGVNINLLAADGLSTLQWAIAGDTEMLEFLLKAGANPDVASTEGATPMMNAVQSNKIDHLKVLIEHKADVNQQDNRGFTALHRAAEMGFIDIVIELLKHDADKKIVAEGHSALSLAIARNHQEIIEVLA
ncbi:MAG: ankyrin repeat domain-containing protein, partial [Bacteroidota bacterium]